MEDDKKLALSVKDFTPEEFNYLYEKSLTSKKISYLPYLLPVKAIFSKSDKIPSFLKIESDVDINLNRITYELLVDLENNFKTFGDPKIIQKIYKELLTRDDLFNEGMNFLENTTEMVDPLYYWYPGLELNDTLSVILKKYSLTEFSARYKKFVAQRLISRTGGPLPILSDRLSPTLKSDIAVMREDRKRFGKRDIVSHSYWCDDCCQVGDYVFKKNLKLYIVSCLSICEIVVDGKVFNVRLKDLQGLYRKDEDSREYWKKIGVEFDEEIIFENISQDLLN